MVVERMACVEICVTNSAKVLQTHYINTCDQCNTHHGDFLN